MIVSTGDGRVIRVFHVKPVPSVLRGTRVGGSGESDAGRVIAEPWRAYNLRRGHTSAVVEGISASEDGRWTAVGRANGAFMCLRLRIICMVVSFIRGVTQLSLYYISFFNDIHSCPSTTWRRNTVKSLREFQRNPNVFENIRGYLVQLCKKLYKKL
jgi:hypothetical protein